MWHPDIPEEYRNQIVTGDARELAKRIPDESVDCILTDPPFGIGYDDWDIPQEQYREFLAWLIQECNRIMKPGALTFVFQPGPHLQERMPLFPSGSRVFCAAKNFVQMRGAIPFAYDPVIFWRKDGAPITKGSGRDWHVGNTANTMNRKMAEAGWHSSPRPLDTIIYMTSNFSPEGCVVLDLFVGSGTLPLACKILGRNYIAFEIDPDTAEKARERVLNTQPPLFVPEPEQLKLDEPATGPSSGRKA